MDLRGTAIAAGSEPAGEDEEPVTSPASLPALFAV
jgi:hypothetical protein